MSRPPAERDPELSESWLELSDDLLAGVGHALNNRVAALSAVSQVIASTTEGPLTDVLSAESSRLQRAVHLLRLLVRRWAAEPEPIQLTDVLADAAELLGHHPDLRSAAIRVEADPLLPPILSERSSLLHAFCIILAPAAQAAEHAGEGAVSVRCSGNAREVRVEIPFHAPRDQAAREENEHPPAAVDPTSARGLLERAGGELSVREEGGEIAGLEVRLPTLAEARRREREGAPPAPDARG